MRYLRAALIAIPSSFVLGTVTAMLSFRFWGWFEEKTGIESLGHSGPATWVYVFCWIIWLLPLLVKWSRRPSSRSGR